MHVSTHLIPNFHYKNIFFVYINNNNKFMKSEIIVNLNQITLKRK